MIEAKMIMNSGCDIYISGKLIYIIKQNCYVSIIYETSFKEFVVHSEIVRSGTGTCLLPLSPFRCVDTLA
jgi:hypothetical protein